MAEDNKEIATVNTGLPTSVDSSQYGVTLADEDRVMPRLVLLQPTSKIDGAGKFYLNLTGEKFDEIEVVFFENIRGRVMFDPDMSKQESICGSNDRIVPAERFEYPIRQRCVECPFSKRGYFEEEVIGKEKRKKECQETMTLKGMFVDTLMPFLYVARKSALFPINQFLTAASFDTVRKKKPLCCFPIKLKANLITKANQKYYVPVVERLASIERDEFVAMMNKYKDYDIDETFKSESIVDEEGVV